MRQRSLIIACLFSVLAFTANAQRTQVYKEPLAKYKEALDFFDREYYTTTRQLLTEFIDEKPIVFDTENEMAESHARYLIAVCAVELFQPDAEKLLIDFIYSHAYDNADRRMAYYHLGRLYFREREYQEAIEWLKKVEQNDLTKEERDEYKFLLAYCYFFSKDFDKAYTLFNAIKDKTNKYYYPANYYYGYISFTRDEYDNALKSFDRVRESAVYQRILPFYISQVHFRKGDYDKVVAELEPVIEDTRLSYYPELNMTLGQAYFEKGAYAKALPYLEVYHEGSRKVRKEDIYQIGYAYYHTKDYQQAIYKFELLDDEADSLGEQALYLLADSYLKTGNTGNARSAYQKAAAIGNDAQITEYSRFNYAKLSYEAGFDNEAVNALQEYVTAYPNSKNTREAKELLSELFLSAKDYAKAIQIIESIEDKSPKVKRAFQIITFNRAMQLYNDGQYEEAREHFDMSLRYPIEEQYKAMAYFWKGEVYYATGDFQKASWQYANYLSLAKTVSVPNAEWYNVNARYGAGYAYLKRRQYDNAATYFEETIAMGKRSGNADIKNRVTVDAKLRAGDAYYLLKDYGRAISRYEEVINVGGNGQDYAMYQRGYIKGLQGNYNAKTSELLELQRRFPTSKYADVALFEAANTYFELGNNSEAIRGFDKLIANYKNSSYYNEAYLKLGLIYFNDDKFDKSMNAYEKVLQNAPNSTEAKIAFNGLKDITVATGDKKMLANMMKKYPGMMDASEAEKLNYDIAETQFRKQNYELAINKFNEYLQGFPNGGFVLNAHYYRGESHYFLDQFEAALEDFNYIITEAPNRYLEPALSKAARIVYFEQQDHERALQLFKRLLTETENADNKQLANLGIMRSLYVLEQYNDIPTYANYVINSELSKPTERIEANFYLAKVAYTGGDLAAALKGFEQTEQEANNEWAVESAWHIARIRFERGNYDGAIEKAYKIINEMPSYPKWVIRSYILLGECYFKQDNIFQAKATIQSILDNYEPEDELKQEARETLQMIQDAESAKKDNIIQEEDDTSGVLEVEPSETIELVNPEEE